MKTPMLTVDAVIIGEESNVLLIKRKRNPFKGYWALPGGFVEYGETVENALNREVKEETGLTVEEKELLGVYSDPRRDPRGHIVTIVFLVKKVSGGLIESLEAEEIKFFRKLPEKIAFDHKKIILDALKRISLKGSEK